MSSFPEPGRKVGHVLLDVASVVIADLTADDAANLAYTRIQDIDGAVSVEVDDPGPDEALDVSVDLSNVLGPAVVALHWSISRIAEAEGRSTEDVIFELREYLDS